MHDEKIIYVICGPTATGKTHTSITLAHEIDGEVISADSRQVYRGLDIGTAKITENEMEGISHHMIDICDINTPYSVAQFQKQGREIIKDIHSRNKTPIVVGGTGYYIQGLLFDTDIPKVPPQKNIREKYEQYDISTLQTILLSYNTEYRHRIDIHNKRRIVRALEIHETLGYIPETKDLQPYYDNIIWKYIDHPDDILKDRIHTRNVQRLDDGLVEEVQSLINSGITYERLDQLGLEYRHVSQYIQGDIASIDELVQILDTKTWQFVKRQRTWFKKYLPDSAYRR